MNIVYTFDDAYAEVTGVSIVSLLEHNDPNNIHLLIVDCGISDRNKNKLQNIAQRYGCCISFHEPVKLEDKLRVNIQKSNWSDICYIRLFYASILPENIGKALHIDCDTMVRKNIEDLYVADIEDYYYAACIDCYPKPRRQIQIHDGIPYFSNGLLLMNLKKWRKDNIEFNFINYIMENNGSLPHLDQDVLNYVCGEKCFVLPAKYNVMTHTLMYGSLCCDLFKSNEPYYSSEEIDKTVEEPCIVHFTGSRYARRPWQQPSKHWYSQEWINYYKKTGYYQTKSLLGVTRKFSFIKHIYSVFWLSVCKISIIKELRFNLDRKYLWKI